jgi:hypothetical protein
MKSRAKVYTDGLNTQQRRMKAVKKVANGCWWVELYLMDSCGISSAWKRNKNNG